MPGPAVTLNTVLLTNQPSKMVVKTPQGSFDVMEEGNVQGSSNTYGWEVTMEWGPRFALNEVLTELRTRRGGLDEVRLQFIDIVGVAYDLNMLWEHDPDFVMTLSWALEPITITLRDIG